MNNNNVSSFNSGTWLPLKDAIRGRVVRNLITTEATRSINPHLVDIWYGSEVLAVEVLRVASSNSLAQETWLRGYVVGNPSIRFEQIQKIDPSSTKPEPSVQTGVFPAGHVQWDHQPDHPDGPTFEPSDTQAEFRGTVELPALESLSIARPSSGTDTINSCIQDSIQDWSSRLPVYLANRQYKLFDGVTKEIQLLMSYRLQLDSGILTKKQDNRVRVEVLKILNRGNALQGLDLVVRHPETGKQPVLKEGGQGDWNVTPLRLYLAQLATASLDAPKISPEETRLSNLYLTHQGKGIPPLQDVRSAIRNPTNPAEASKYLVAEVKAIIIRTDPGESLELYLSIYDNTPTKKAFITEEFLYQAIKGGHITEKSSVAFRIGGNDGIINSLYLVVKVVRVVIGGMDGSYRRYPFGVSVTPLLGLLDTPSEKVLQAEPWARGSIFSSMHEDLVEKKNTASATKHRIVVGMQLSPTNRIVRNAALCRSLSGSSPAQDVADADVYIKLWSAVLPDPIPDEVYVKMTLYSTDQHRLVDCIFPGGSGSGTSSEGALEYKSVVWQKTPSASTPVFGDLVRFRISRQHLQSGYVQFSIMAADRGPETNPPQGSNEWVAFNVEMPLASNPGSELWVQDGEHTLVSPNPACALTVRALSLVPFGFKDANIAYALTQPPGDISVDRISLLRYAPVEELKRHAGKLLDYLFSAMLADTTNFPLHAAVLDVLATFLEEEMLQAACAVCTLGPSAKRQAVQLLLEAVSLALSDRSRRNSTLKCLSMVFRLGRLMLDASLDGQEAIEETLSAIRSQLITIASSKDDHVGQTLALRHWPFATFGEPEDIIKLIDCIRPNTVSEHKSKMRFVIQVLDELALDDSLVAALWRNIKASLSKADGQAVDVIHLAISACGRIIDATCRDDVKLDDVLEYIGADVLQALLMGHGKVANGLDGLNDNGPSNIMHALPSQIVQTTCPAGAEIVIRDIRACIVCVVSRLSPGLEQMLKDLDGGVLADLRNLTWVFLHSVARLAISRPTMASYAAFETKMWLRLCRAMCETVTPDYVTSHEHLATVVALVKHSHPESNANGDLEGDDDAVHGLTIVCRLAAGPESFSKLVGLALEAGSAKIRNVCHEILFTISAGAPNVEVEAFLLLVVHAFVEGSHRVSRVTMLVQEASAIWLTPENGWSAVLEILPRLYGALGNQHLTHPRDGTAFIAVLELVMPFPSVRKALILQLYDHIFDAEGTSAANLLLELAVLCEDPEDKLSLRLHGHVAPRELRVAELHEAAINEAIFMCDFGLAGRILASLTVVAEREGDYRRVSEILTYRSKLARMMQEGSPVWRYFYVRLVDGEMIELIWRARHCEDLLHQVQQAYPEQTIALRERADRTPVPPETDILLVEVDIEPSQPPKPLWAKHDNVCNFTLDLVEGDLAVYEVDSPLPGFLPFASVKNTTRLVQTEAEVVARKMRGKIEMLAYTLNGMGTTDSNGLSNLLDAAIEDVLMTTNVDAGYDDLFADYLSLLLKGLDMHSRMTRGTPMETFHRSLVVNYESRYPMTIREKAELDFSAKNGSKAGMDLLSLAFGSAGSSGRRDHPDRPSEDTLVHGRSAYSDALSPVSTTDGMPYVHVHQSQSPQFFSNPFSPKTTTSRNGSFSPYPMSDRGSLMDRSDLVVSPVTRSPSVASRRIPMGVRRLGSLLSKSRSGSTSSGVV